VTEPATGVEPHLRLGRPIGRRFLIEWAGTACAGVAIVLLGALWHLMSGIDHLLYDNYLRAHSRALSPDIVLVDIDNASIDALGRWPWTRSVHAQLVNRLADAGAAAVVYDVLFTEPSADDAQLAHAISRVPTFLPILFATADDNGRGTAVKPVEPIARAAAGLGHINLEVDRDGIVRSVALFEGDGASRWPQLMVPVWRAIRDGSVQLADSTAATRDVDDPTRTAEPGGEARFLIPFGSGASAYPTVSFAQVLEGRVRPDLLRGRVVLIGVTAAGLYDRFATPMSGTLGPLPGVHIHANILDMLLGGTEIEPAASAWVALASLLPLALLLAGFLVLSPWRALVLLVVLVVASLGGSAALLYGARLWLSPAPAIAALVICYALWSWRRLEMTMAYLRKELRRLADEPYLLPEAHAPAAHGGFGGDALAQQMALMAQAAQRLQDMRRFVWDSLDSVPEPLVVTDLRGVVLIANHAARARFAMPAAVPAQGRHMGEVFGDLEFVKTIDGDADAGARARAQWPAPLDPSRSEFAALMESGVEVRSREGRAYLLRYASCTNTQGQAVGRIAGLVDVTLLHDAERQREDALRLLSHDMRSPQASIVTLVETERACGTIESAPMRELMARIERYARRSLELADDFVQLARAESQPYVLEPASLADLLIDASDEVWPQARAKGIRIETPLEDAEMGWISADRSLICRTLVNLLNNAVKYSPADTRIVCAIRAANDGEPRVVCSISDQGYGIADDDRERLFKPFQRLHAAQRPEVSGIGLGMAFVWTVVTRHGGEIAVDSEVGSGTTITLSFPALEG
jgi:CHASE2 domain-containing sensor protein/signal transduction histidine kinase